MSVSHEGNDKFQMKTDHHQVNHSYSHTPGYTSPDLQTLQHHAYSSTKHFCLISILRTYLQYHNYLQVLTQLHFA